MFIRLNKVLYFENKLNKVFQYFKGDIIALHLKEINNDNLFGENTNYLDIQIIYIAILLGVIEFHDVNNIENYEINVNKFNKCLACSGIDIDKIYKLFGLLGNNDFGINTLGIEDNFIIEPDVLLQVDTYTKQDIKSLIELTDYCEYKINNTTNAFYLIVEANGGTNVYLEL